MAMKRKGIMGYNQGLKHSFDAAYWELLNTCFISTTIGTAS